MRAGGLASFVTTARAELFLEVLGASLLRGPRAFGAAGVAPGVQNKNGAPGGHAVLFRNGNDQGVAAAGLAAAGLAAAGLAAAGLMAAGLSVVLSAALSSSFFVWNLLSSAVPQSPAQELTL